MDELIKAIHTTPIIDNHAHPLLTPPAQSKYPLLSITTEAHGDAIRATASSLSHIRAVNQLSYVLGCPPTWEDVVKAIDVEKAKPHHVWQRRCLEGIETILVDDGLDDGDEVYDYSWHDKLVRSECKRIVRIEKIAEEIIDALLKQPDIEAEDVFGALRDAFEIAIQTAIDDPEVVGFKSIICYRTGLDILPVVSSSEVRDSFVDFIAGLQDAGITDFKRLDGSPLNSYLANKTAQLISLSPKHKKPLQFHTGLGDNDITLTKSSPSHLQGFIRRYPTVPVVLLHASYPWTKEAGYLASVYDNVYADIGEVFPFVSREGQEKVVREILELCPTEKLLWSTDGHWFPETYLLAVIQVREALEVVFTDYVQSETLTVPQAIRAVEDIFFKTSNDLYDLHIPFKPLVNSTMPLPVRSATNSQLDTLTAFLNEYTSTKFLRLQYLDYTSTPRVRIIPVKKALSLLENSPQLSIGITKVSLSLLQNDTNIPGANPTGEYRLQADLSSLRPGPYEGYAFVQGEFHEADGSIVDLCPRSLLRRWTKEAKSQNLEFLVGFEIEIVFMSRDEDGDLQTLSNSGGHAWSSNRALHGNKILDMLHQIYDSLAVSGIYLEQWHPEAATGQYEFVLPPLPPLQAADALLHAREIISTVVAGYSMRATLYPKPFSNMAGTASHIHISISSPDGDKKEVYEPFYAGVLKHLQALIAFTYSSPSSYDRMVDSAWAGGRWVAWGTQNRETALRKIEGSHFEIKVVDGLANVYLALAAIIAAGILGVRDKLELTLADCLRDPGQLSDEERQALGIKDMLPKDLETALQALEEDTELTEQVGKDIVVRYVQVKKAEIDLLNGMRAPERKQWIMERY
ncbi:developmental protein FluG [Stipitochalara longipes BDJ]|nr:developmental protein FluG [Stipitochalara longipes BDJ]